MDAKKILTHYRIILRLAKSRATSVLFLAQSGYSPNPKRLALEHH